MLYQLISNTCKLLFIYLSIYLSIYNAASNIDQVLEATPQKAPTVRPPTSYRKKLSKLDEPKMQDTAGEAGTSS